MVSVDDIRRLLGEVLQLGGRADELTADSALLGNLPEFDSMAVVSVITSLEEQYGIIVEDDDISAESFETLGHLTDFVNSKL